MLRTFRYRPTLTNKFVFVEYVIMHCCSQEWSIAEQRKLEAKPPVTPPSKIETVDPEDCKLTREQESLQLPVRP